MAEELKEYIVTLKRHEDLDSFYEDMESPGGNLYIPNRSVEVTDRRPISRNTHYYLSKAEAELLKTDHRVLDVELNLKDRNIEIVPAWTQTSVFSKKNSVNVINTDKNWGLFRTINGSQVSGWGSGLGGTSLTTVGTVARYLDGTNVDLVIVDGILKNTHVEFTYTLNGQSVSRVNRYNWYSLNPTVRGTAQSTYFYQDTTNNANHGTFVASVAAGKTQGIARNANIYNISPFGENDIGLLWFDYIRAWHNQKSVNPKTLVKNPSVVNCSFVFRQALKISDISLINYRGQNYLGPWTNTGNGSFLYTDLGFGTQPAQYFANDANYYLYVYPQITSVQADIEDTINAGISIIFPAGDDSRKLDTSTGQDYNNRVTTIAVTDFYINRPVFSNTSTVITVGGIGTNVDESISQISNRGPEVDIWAPSENIVGATIEPGALLPTGNNDYVSAISGTSAAAAQVSGVVTAIRQVGLTTLSPLGVKNFIVNQAKNNQITQSGTGLFTDPYHLQGAPNKLLFMPEVDISFTSNTNSVSGGDTVLFLIALNSGFPFPIRLYIQFTGTADQNDFSSTYQEEYFIETFNSFPINFTHTIIDKVLVAKFFQGQIRLGGFDGPIVAQTPVINISPFQRIAGEFDWKQTGFLGTITMSKPSELSIAINSTSTSLNLEYYKKSGNLPDGISIARDGSIVGFVTTTSSTSGTTFYSVVGAVRKVGGDEITSNTFTIELRKPQTVNFTKVYVKPFLNSSTRQTLSSLFQNKNIFPPKYLYRPFDSNFGIQTDLRSYVHYGIENLSGSLFNSTRVENFYRRRFILSNPKIAYAYDSNNNIKYEVVYLPLLDKNINEDGVSLPIEFFGPDSFRYNPASITNWRQNLESVGESTNLLDPDFMQSFQPNASQILGFIGCVVLCYTQPGRSKAILNNINKQNIVWNKIDYEIDRFFVVRNENNTDDNMYTFPTNPGYL